MKTKPAMLGIILAIFVLGTTLSATFPVTSQSTPEIFVINPMNPANPTAKDGSFVFSTDTTSVGFKFNATLWASGFVDPAVYAWQVTLYYSNTILNATRAWLPSPTDPDYILFGHSSVRPKPSFGSNYVKIGDTSLDTTVTSATPKKLGTIEFQIMLAPQAGNKVSCNLDINNGDTYLLDFDLNEITTTKTGGYYELAARAVPDFSISASPSSLTIIQGDSGNSTINITSLNGFNSVVSLSISGLPNGATASFDPISVTPPSDGFATSTLTINVSASVASDTYPLTVTATSETLSHNVAISLTVTAAPDFSISASPASVTIALEGSANSTITVTSMNGFNEIIDLSVSGVPTGVTTTLSASSITPPANGETTSILTINVGASTIAGTYTLTITGTSEASSHNATIELTVAAAQDFSITASPDSLTIVQGASGTSTITIGSLKLFNSAVTLSVSGVPTGVTTSFSANPVTPPSGSFITSTLTVNVGASTVVGTYSLTVTGTTETLTHNTTVALTVTAPPDFTIAASPTSLSITLGGSGTSTITVTSLNGFNSEVGLTISGLPADTTGTFNPASITPAPDGSATSTLTINVGASTALGTYSLTVIGTGGTLSHNTTIELTVAAAQDFSISASPSSLTIIQGESGNSTITVGSLNGFNSAVDLTVSGLPADTTATFNLASVTPPSGGSATSTLTINVGSSTANGTYSITIMGKSGTLAHNVTIALTVIAAPIPITPDFSISASPNSLTTVQGTSGTSDITVASLNGFNSEVALTVSGLPAGAIGTFNPTSITPPSDGNATSTLTIALGVSVAPGTYMLTIIGTSGTLSHNVTISLTVTAAPDFSISASPNSLTIVQGSSGTSTITVTSLNGFNSAVNLSISGLPTGTTGTFSLASITPSANGSATSTLTVNVGLSTAIGTYSLIVTGISQGKTHSVSINLTVTAAPDFALSTSPSSLIIVQGSSGNSTITVMSINGFNKSVALSVSGAPTGVTTTLSLVSVTPLPNGSATSKLTVSVDVAATAGSFTLTITGTSETLTHNTTISLTVVQSQVIAAKVRIEPRTLNLRSRGGWITVHIKLPENLSVADIDISTVMINGTIPAELQHRFGCACIGDHELILKFDRSRVIQYILDAINPTKKFMTVTLTVSGRLNDGRQIQGSDKIKTILPPRFHDRHDTKWNKADRSESRAKNDTGHDKHESKWNTKCDSRRALNSTIATLTTLRAKPLKHK